MTEYDPGLPPCPGEISKALLAWFVRHKRPLVFRRDKNPYFVWVSEIMAQQTRIAALTPYFERFIAAFPTVESLAQAGQEDVLRLWAGLGYYSRARNLHKAAQIIARTGFPQRLADLKALPGVGEYTAGAIASIAFGQKTPAVDGNVLRVFSRIAGREEPADTLKKDARHWVLTLMEGAPAGDITEAVMELGALVCVPQKPRCGDCPLTAACAAYQTGRQEQLPQMPPKKAQREVCKEVWLHVNADNAVLVRRRTERLLHGMYEFPDTRLFEEGEAIPAGTASHVFTHLRWRMTGFYLFIRRQDAPEGYIWATRQQLEALPFPAAMGYFLQKAKADPPPKTIDDSTGF